MRAVLGCPITPGVGWPGQPHVAVPAELIADVQVWCAATQVDPSDLRPTGPPQLGRAARLFQQQLDKCDQPGHPN
jgi:hypothetical protein